MECTQSLRPLWLAVHASLTIFCPNTWTPLRFYSDFGPYRLQRTSFSGLVQEKCAQLEIEPMISRIPIMWCTSVLDHSATWALKKGVLFIPWPPAAYHILVMGNTCQIWCTACALTQWSLLIQPRTVTLALIMIDKSCRIIKNKKIVSNSFFCLGLYCSDMT
jgi:hypothetical protein